MGSADTAREQARDRVSGRFGEQNLADPGTGVLDGSQPATTHPQDVVHRADRVFTAIERAIRPEPHERSSHYRIVLDDGWALGTNAYILVKARTAVADGCDNIGIDPAEARKAAAATKGEMSPGLRLDDGRDAWLEIGGQPIYATRPGTSADTLNRIVDDFQADWDDAAMRGKPEDWQSTADLLASYKGCVPGDCEQHGTSMFPKRRLERAVKVARDLGVKQLLLQTQSQTPNGVRKGRRPIVKLIGPGVEIVVMGVLDRNM